jgi:DNA invertase Pin-like site-specific DNA recombinase
MDGETLERQQQQILSYCELKGLPTPTVISDAAASGYKSNRPGYLKVVELCRSGNVDTLIVYDLSRLSRSVRTTLEFIEDVVNRYHINFVSLKQDINTATPGGRAFLAISAVFNQLYRDEISYKTKAALEHKKANNLKGAGITQFGLKVVDGKRLVKDPQEQAVIEKLIHFRKLGLSYPQICERLQQLGIPTKTNRPTWTPSTVKRILDRVLPKSA